VNETHKGIGFIRETDCNDVSRLNGSWYYNWWYVTECTTIETTFIPMIWSHGQVNDEVLTAIRRQRPPAVLTWNEPSLKTQAALPLLDRPEHREQVMGYWRRINEALRPDRIRIGSPAPAPEEEDLAWTRHFLLEAKDRDMSPDFVALHYYWRPGGGTSGAESYRAFLRTWRDWLDEILQLSLPIWVTEFGCIEKNEADNRKFMEDTFDMMLGQGGYNELHVERYCWFANRTFHPVFRDSALINSDGTLTEVGAIYRSIPAAFTR
jgi:hypothetical protein